MHLVDGGEDALVVGEDVVGCERDELTSTPENLPEERMRIERVSEGDGEQH